MTRIRFEGFLYRAFAPTVSQALGRTTPWNGGSVRPLIRHRQQMVRKGNRSVPICSCQGRDAADAGTGAKTKYPDELIPSLDEGPRAGNGPCPQGHRSPSARGTGADRPSVVLAIAERKARTGSAIDAAQGHALDRIAGLQPHDAPSTPLCRPKVMKLSAASPQTPMAP